jgi:hypothetical protein
MRLRPPQQQTEVTVFLPQVGGVRMGGVMVIFNDWLTLTAEAEPAPAGRNLPVGSSFYEKAATGAFSHRQTRRRGMIAIISLFSMILGGVAAVQAERYPAYVRQIETAAGVLLIGGLGLIGAALPIAV